MSILSFLEATNFAKKKGSKKSLIETINSLSNIKIIFNLQKTSQKKSWEIELWKVIFEA